MKPVIVAGAVSLLAGAALGAILFDDDSSDDREPTPVNADAGSYFDAAAPVEQRLDMLERIVAEERNARVILEDQLNALLDEIERIDSEGPQIISDEVKEMVAQRASDTESVASTTRSSRRRPQDRDSQIEQLVDGGFDSARASWMVDELTQYQLDAMQTRYDANMSGDMSNITREMLQPEFRLREQIGDDEYSQYLEATGRPTAVPVDSVIASSAASQAGMQPGDRIVAYNGERVFSMFDLRTATFAADPGSNVIIDIERGGAPMQVSLPAGPMGISGGSGSRFPRGRGRGN